MSITNLTPTSLVAVPVSSDAHNFTIDDRELFYQAAPTEGFSFVPVAYKIILPDGKYTILGTVSPKEVGFDCEPWVSHSDWSDEAGNFRVYMDYYIKNWECTDAKQSFRSLLQSHNLELDKNYLIINKIS